MTSTQVYFVDDHFLAEFYCSELKKKFNGLMINTFSFFEEYFDKVILKYSHLPFICITFNFYEIQELLTTTDQTFANSKINFVTGQGIDGVKIDFVPIANPYSKYETQSDLSIIHHYLTGIEIRLNKKICQSLIEKASMMQKLKAFHLDEEHTSLKEFLEKIGSNLLKYFKADCGRIAFWGKAHTNQQLVNKTYGKSHLKSYEYNKKANLTLKDQIQIVDNIADENLKKQLKSLGIKYPINIHIDSQHAYGRFDLLSKLDKIGHAEHELIGIIRKKLPQIIDNTYFFQDMLRKHGAAISVFDNTQDAIMVVDNNRLVVDINEACEILTGWSKKEAIGKPCKELWHSCDYYSSSICDSNHCPMLIPLIEKVNTTKQRIYTQNKMGAGKIVKSNYFLSTNSMNQVDYGVAVVRDLTERIQLEDKLQRFEQLAGLGKFTAELAHEIRNPITGISSNAQFLLEEAQCDKNLRGIAKEIFCGINAVEATLKKYLDLGHPPQPHVSEVDINEVLKDTINILKRKLDRTKIELDLSFCKYLPRINLDHDLIQQVFINVIMNSIEAMQHGGRLEIETWLALKRKVSGQKKKKYVAVKMSDTGCGIAPEILEKIFDPFFTTKPTGSGLGLYTSYRILKDHDAFIEVQSKQNRGVDTFIYFKTTG